MWMVVCVSRRHSGVQVNLLFPPNQLGDRRHNVRNTLPESRHSAISTEHTYSYGIWRHSPIFTFHLLSSGRCYRVSFCRLCCTGGNTIVFHVSVGLLYWLLSRLPVVQCWSLHWGLKWGAWRYIAVRPGLKRDIRWHNQVQGSTLILDRPNDRRSKLIQGSGVPNGTSIWNGLLVSYQQRAHMSCVPVSPIRTSKNGAYLVYDRKPTRLPMPNYFNRANYCWRAIFNDFHCLYVFCSKKVNNSNHWKKYL